MTALGRCSFQGRALARALDVWETMCRDAECLRVMSLAGAMVPAGMGLVVVRLIEAGLVDVLVPTGAALSHDLCNLVGAGAQAPPPGRRADRARRDRPGGRPRAAPGAVAGAPGPGSPRRAGR